jgi:hypothetical protein
MNRKLTTERLFSLGDYKNIKFTDEISDIPEKWFLNEEVINRLKYLQLIQIEMDHKNYAKLSSMITECATVDKMLEELEKLRQTTLQELLEKLTNGKIEGD